MANNETDDKTKPSEIEHKKFKLTFKLMSPFTEHFSKKGVKYWRATARLITRKTSIRNQPVHLCTRNRNTERKLKMWDTITILSTYDPREKLQRELDDGNWAYLWGWEPTVEIINRPDIEVEEI